MSLTTDKGREGSSFLRTFFLKGGGHITVVLPSPIDQFELVLKGIKFRQKVLCLVRATAKTKIVLKTHYLIMTIEGVQGDQLNLNSAKQLNLQNLF